jgi:hypothetical protein
MVTSQVFDHAARLRSFGLLAEVLPDMVRAPAAALA